MDRGVLYFLRGRKHTEHFLVSLFSLRQVWRGPVHVLVADGQAAEIVARAASDKRTELRYSMIEPDNHGRGGTYATKTKLPWLSPFGATVLLDADTIIRQPFEQVGEQLFPQGEEIVLTQFARWTTAGRRIAGRVRAWAQVAPHEVARMTGGVAYPAINTGVMGWLGDGGSFAKHWRSMCLRNVRFICDEIAAQLVFPDHQHRVLSDVWNCSPVHSSPKSIEAAAILHGHGQKFFKKAAGWKLWRPYWEQALAENFGGLGDWARDRNRINSELRTALEG